MNNRYECIAVDFKHHIGQIENLLDKELYSMCDEYSDIISPLINMYRQIIFPMSMIVNYTGMFENREK